MSIANHPTETPRVKKLRLEIANAIPRIPNDRDSLSVLQNKGLAGVLIDFVNWRSRYVGVRPRSVVIKQSAQDDPRWRFHATEIESFLAKVCRGDDLTPHLSTLPHRRGFAAAAQAPMVTQADRWSDKDFVLNAMGFHHFHLDEAVPGRAGHKGGTGNLIFARVSRDEFTVDAIFDHSVFSTGSDERNRLYDIHDDIVLRDAVPDVVYISSFIATSGHALQVVKYAQQLANKLTTIDPRLNDREFVEGIYEGSGIEPPYKPRFEWWITHLDLGLLDEATGVYFNVQQGWN